MAEIGRKFLYRIFCMLALLVSVYLMVDLYLSHTLDYKVIILFMILIFVILFGLWDWGQNYAIQRKQEEELKIYKLYIKPLEELTKNIRMRQHEFDNHMNAILNMHVTMNNYDELVKAQSAYGKEIYEENSRCNIALLRISDKILAGFLYSKIISAPAYIHFDVQVLNQEILSQVSEHTLIEIMGTLVDNAIEACTEEKNEIEMVLDDKGDKLVFRIRNQVNNLKMSDISHFFERGFTTKENKEGHGLGLYQANLLAQRFGGEITVSLEQEEKVQKISFQVEI